MKNKYIRLITFAALIAILILQGMWLYNTYKFVEADYIKETSKQFINSVEKEAVLRLNDPKKNRKAEGKKIEEILVENDHYIKNRDLQDFLYNEDFPPISLEKLDSIFKKETNNKLRHYYSLTITDSLGNQTDFLSDNSNPSRDVDGRFAYKETIQLRNINPKYITLTISASYQMGFVVGFVIGKMFLMLIASFIVAVIVIYGLVTQIKIIRKQDRIAKLRQDFTNAMIHDMKNPVTSILMGVNTLKSGKIDNNLQMKEQFYSIITQESERILKLANKVLEIAQFEEQGVVLSRQQIDLSELLEKLKAIYTSKTSKNVNFNIELNGVENIYADVHYIYEAFDNLIENAVKYSKEDEDVNIQITSLYKGNSVQIIFKDTGIGISDKDQKKIFKKFERSMSVIESRKKISGFGLGLNLVYQVIRAHGGTIGVNSKLGSYSEFIISLPVEYSQQTPS